MRSVRQRPLTPQQRKIFDRIRRFRDDGWWLFKTPGLDGPIEWYLGDATGRYRDVLPTRTCDSLWRRKLLIRDVSRSTLDYWVFSAREGLPYPARPTMHFTEERR